MNDLIKAILPIIGTGLLGPLGGIVAGVIGPKLGMNSASVEDVKNILNGMPPEKLAELKAHEIDVQLQLAKLGYDSLDKIEDCNIRAMEAVNKTMQAESASEHWPTYSWRPFIGFSVGFNLISASLVIFIAYIWQHALVAQIPTMLTALAGLNATALPILGVASYFRGKMQADPTIPTTNKG